MNELTDGWASGLGIDRGRMSNGGWMGCPSPCPRAKLKFISMEMEFMSMSQWCYPTVPSSTTSFFLPSICPSISGFPHQVAKVLELQAQNIQTDFLQDWLFDLCSPRDFIFSSTTIHIHFGTQSSSFMVQSSHLNMTTGKTIALTIQTFCWQWFLCFLTCGFVIFTRSKHFKFP